MVLVSDFSKLPSREESQFSATELLLNFFTPERKFCGGNVVFFLPAKIMLEGDRDEGSECW